MASEGGDAVGVVGVFSGGVDAASRVDGGAGFREVVFSGGGQLLQRSGSARRKIARRRKSMSSPRERLRISSKSASGLRPPRSEISRSFVALSAGVFAKDFVRRRLIASYLSVAGGVVTRSATRMMTSGGSAETTWAYFSSSHLTLRNVNCASAMTKNIAG